jgi:hypothetical protein
MNCQGRQVDVVVLFDRDSMDGVSWDGTKAIQVETEPVARLEAHCVDAKLTEWIAGFASFASSLTRRTVGLVGMDDTSTSAVGEVVSHPPLQNREVIVLLRLLDVQNAAMA